MSSSANDAKKDAAPPLAPPERSRSPWQLLYAGAHALRVRYWRGRARRLPRPVISVGNLHWGGAGKTPATIAIAGHLRDRGYGVAVLSRGYGSQGGDGVRIVSRGDGPLLGPRIAGDEPVLLAGQLPGVAVVVCPDRYRAGRDALERLDRPPDIFVLDDGFSHLQLHRDLDLLVFPAADPFGGAKLAPGGRLREPLAASRRAHAALLTGERPDGGLPAMAQQLARVLRPFGFAGPAFAAPTATGAPSPELARPGSKALVVSGIARPEAFLATVRSQGIEVADVLSFPDHFRYPDAAIKELIAHFAKCGADFLLVTSKDMVKLRGRLDLPIAELPIACQPEDGFFTWLEARLAELAPRRG